MRQNNNNLPPFAEQIIITTVEDLQSILDNFKQIIPSNFKERKNK